MYVFIFVDRDEPRENFNSESAAATWIFDRFPEAVAAPYQEKSRRFFNRKKKKNQSPLVLVIWERPEDPKNGKEPIGFIQEVLVGFHQALWDKNILGGPRHDVMR